MKPIITPEARRAIEVGRKNHYRFQVVQEEDFREGWVYDMPGVIEEDVPKKGQKRLELLKREGIEYDLIFIAHEAPKLLAGPVGQNGSIPAYRSTIIETIITILFSLIALDPTLIVVLRDGTWLQVMTWYE